MLLASLVRTSGVCALGRLRNLSITGALFEPRVWVNEEEPVIVGQMLMLDVRFPFSPVSCSLSVRVVHRGAAAAVKGAFGLEFVDVDADAREAIERVLAAAAG